MLEEELGVTKKRHCRRLREAIITLAKNDVDYKALVDFLVEYHVDKFFNRFIRAGVTTPDDLIVLHRKGDVQSFLENPPMHLKDLEQTLVKSAIEDLAASIRYPTSPQLKLKRAASFLKQETPAAPPRRW